MSESGESTIVVSPSAPLELMWLMHFSQANHEHEGVFASLEPLRRRFGPKLDALRQDGLRQYSTELIVLAHRSGTLTDIDPGRFFDRIPEAIADTSPLPSLRSEGPDEVKVTAERLARLRSDPERRKRYAALLREMWDAVEPEWNQQGEVAVLAEAERWKRSLDNGTPYRQLLLTDHLWSSRPELDPLADAAARSGNLVLAPCWFGGKIHIIELDGLFHVGRGIRHSDPSYRKLAATISTSIKALADPTRLAILLRLAHDPASVTDIAREFCISQPTVSAHVQILREQGLLEEKTVGRRAMLSASEEGLRRLFTNAEESLVQAFRG